MIRVNEHTVSNIGVSTITGHSGKGMFPLTLNPDYREAMNVIKATKTTVFPKSSTRFKHIGNYRPWQPWTWKCIRDLPGMGMLNAYGLTNPGIIVCGDKISSSIDKEYNVIPNYFPQFGGNLDLTIKLTEEAIRSLAQKLGDHFWAIELNFSCPNDKTAIKDNIVSAVKLVNRLKIIFPWLTIIAKTSIVHPYSFLQELETAGVDIFHLVNTIPYNMLFNDMSPLHNLGGGGVSGSPAFEMAFKYSAEARKKINKPTIMGCGVTTEDNLRKYIEEGGADAVSICTGLKRNTKEMIKLIEVYN